VQPRNSKKTYETKVSLTQKNAKRNDEEQMQKYLSLHVQKNLK